MTTFPGVATLDEGTVPVTIGLDDDRITIQVGETSIREWPALHCDVRDVGSGEFVIEAEDDTAIPFHPDDPGSFARGLGLWSRPDKSSSRPETPQDGHIEVREGPAPRQVTVVAFYALAAVTAALCIWALLTIVM